MPAKGRPRLTLEAYRARLKAYCGRYDVKPTDEGLAPFPTGRRETRQHREWLSLYKAHSRLARRQRGQCERCSKPVSEGSVFCEAHRGEASPRVPASTPVAELRRLLKVQDGRCPICAEAVELASHSEHVPAAGARSILHPGCKRLVDLAEASGSETFQRAFAYLWPRGPKPGRRTT